MPEVKRQRRMGFAARTRYDVLDEAGRRADRPFGRTSAGIGRVVTAGQHLNGPLGLAITPKGDILTVNGGDGNIVSAREGSVLQGQQVQGGRVEGAPGLGARAVPRSGLYRPVQDRLRNLLRPARSLRDRCGTDPYCAGAPGGLHSTSGVDESGSGSAHGRAG